MTGDWVTVDEHGYVRVVGRKKDIIIRGGYNIDPSEIEALVRSRPDVLDAAVFGLPDERLGEIVCLSMVSQPGHRPTDMQIIHELRDRGLSPQKLPQVFDLREDFPLSPDGKILQEAGQSLGTR